MHPELLALLRLLRQDHQAGYTFAWHSPNGTEFLIDLTDWARAGYPIEDDGPVLIVQEVGVLGEEERTGYAILVGPIVAVREAAGRRLYQGVRLVPVDGEEAK